MNLKEFAYNIPESLIAQDPLRDREQARLMVVDRAAEKIYHNIFKNVGSYLPKESLLVLNDTKVVPARLLGKREKSDAPVEVFLLKKLEERNTFETLMRPLKRLKNGDKLLFNGGSITAEVIDTEKRTVRFSADIDSRLDEIGHMPLPPYIKRQAVNLDKEFYQTVYAKKPGSVAAPTAGLHFTQELIDLLEREEHSFEKVTLHINYATFKPVTEADITEHQMHKEDYSVAEQAYENIKAAKKADKKVVAVGTTSCRVLETIAKTQELSGTTGLYIYPGYKFKMTDCLITNFHLPYSTLLMLVYAFGGKGLMKTAYQEAIKERYRFFSYGDAMMII